MSMISTYQLISRIEIAVAADPRTMLTAPSRVIPVDLSLLTSRTRIFGMGAWRDNVQNDSEHLRCHQVNVQPRYESHFTASLQALRYQQRSEDDPVTWRDREEREHTIQELWTGPSGAIGLTRLPNDLLLAYTRSQSAEDDLYQAGQEFSLRLLSAYFGEKAGRTFAIPTGDGGTLPTRVRLVRESDLQLQTEVLNPRRDDRCRGAVALVRELFGDPHYQKELLRPRLTGRELVGAE